MVFEVEYVRKKDANHLAKSCKTKHKISQDWEGKKISGINLEQNYAPNHTDQTCCLSMNNYISDLLIDLDHPAPRRRQLSPTDAGRYNTAARFNMTTKRTHIFPLRPKAQDVSNRLLEPVCGLVAQ